MKLKVALHKLKEDKAKIEKEIKRLEGLGAVAIEHRSQYDFECCYTCSNREDITDPETRVVEREIKCGLNEFLEIDYLDICKHYKPE